MRWRTISGCWGYFLSSANSINWGRILPQVVYYISAYCDLLRDGEIKMGDKDKVFKVIAGSTMRTAEYKRIWEYPQLKCYYKLPEE